MATTNSISRTVKLCRWHARVNPLWLWAYCGMALLLHAYLLYRAVTRCRLYNELPWRTEDKPVLELYVYISLIVVSVMCLPFFIITSIFKVNNYPGDGVRLGRDNIHEEELAEAAGALSLANPTGSISNLGNESPNDDYIQTMPQKPLVTSQRTCGGKMHTLWCRIGPFSHGFHVISAFSLLLPSVLLEAQEIKYGFQNPEVTWRSELDVLLGWRNLRSSSPNNVMEYSPRVDNTTPDDAKDSLAQSDSRVPEITISPEYINYIIALSVYCVRYAAVFWYTKMSFSIICAFQFLIITVHFAFSFCGMGLLYKFQVNTKGFKDLNLVLPPPVTLVLYMLGSFFLLIHGLPMFNYGFYHYMERWHTFLKTYAPSYFKKKKIPSNCQGYSPHVMATVVLILVIACRAAIVYDYVVLYRKTGFPVILGSIIMDAVYMVSWISLWFALTIKQSWSFRIMFARYVLPSMKKRGGKRSLNSSQNPTPERNSSPSSGDASPTTNRNVVTVNADVVDANDSQNTSSALRKNNHRRSLPNQRVKFDKASKEKSENSKDNKKKKGVRRVQSDSLNGKGNSSEVESSSESTLTRTYRNSIRDKCDSYYTIGKEGTPPPAAQSSPRLPTKRLSKGPAVDEAILLNPLTADKQYPVNLAYEPDPIVHQKHSPDGVPLRSHPPSYGKDHHPSSRHPDARYSYPLAGPWIPPPMACDVYSSTPPKYPPHDIYVNRVPRSARRSLQLERPLPNLHEGTYLANSDLYLPSSRRGSPSVQKLPETPTDSIKKGAPPRPPRPHTNQPKVARELRYKKPDLSHRDSALPSSNETSSNDSNDVLCSQV